MRGEKKKKNFYLKDSILYNSFLCDFSKEILNYNRKIYKLDNNLNFEREG